VSKTLVENLWIFNGIVLYLDFSTYWTWEYLSQGTRCTENMAEAGGSAVPTYNTQKEHDIALMCVFPS